MNTRCTVLRYGVCNPGPWCASTLVECLRLQLLTSNWCRFQCVISCIRDVGQHFEASIAETAQTLLLIGDVWFARLCNYVHYEKNHHILYNFQMLQTTKNHWLKTGKFCDIFYMTPMNCVTLSGLREGRNLYFHSLVRIARSLVV